MPNPDDRKPPLGRTELGFTRTLGGDGGRFDWHRGGEQEDALWFFCPGCESAIRIPISGARAWGWDGNLDAPTLTPSILSIGERRCHAFMRSGKLEFLSDCTHVLAGKTIDVPVLPDWMRG